MTLHLPPGLSEELVTRRIEVALEAIVEAKASERPTSEDGCTRHCRDCLVTGAL